MVLGAAFAIYSYFFPWSLDWRHNSLVDPQEQEPRWFVYAARLRDPDKQYLGKTGEHVTLPDRIVLVGSGEREAGDPESKVRFGDGVIMIPYADLTFDLTSPGLQDRVERFNQEYSTPSEEYGMTVLYLDRLDDHQGNPTYVLARLTDRTATRCVWSVTPEGEPIPLTIAFTHDREGYRYRDSITKKEALYKDLKRPQD